MTRQNNNHAPQHISLRIIHRAHSALTSHVHSTMKRRSDEGSMLVEVLVALLILVIVFTSSTLLLSNLAGQRVSIEQRDRAVRLISEYEEMSRILRCGLIVDKADDGTTTEFDSRASACSFDGTAQGGDRHLVIDDPDSELEFTIDIRYWWEVPGSDIHTAQCVDIRDAFSTNSPPGILPSLYVRAFEVTWTEKGEERSERLIKKDPVPVDDVVFALGNRNSLLLEPVSNALTFSVGGASRINRITSLPESGEPFPGQPTQCLWFPYLKPVPAADSDPRFFNGNPESPASEPVELGVR